VLPVQYILANDLGRRNGLSFPDPAPYTAVSTYYNDFVAGNYDVCIGSWDTFAARYQAGVPIKYVCTITDANMIALLAPKAGVADVSAAQRQDDRCPAVDRHLSDGQSFSSTKLSVSTSKRMRRSRTSTIPLPRLRC